MGCEEDVNAEGVDGTVMIALASGEVVSDGVVSGGKSAFSREKKRYYREILQLNRGYNPVFNHYRENIPVIGSFHRKFSDISDFIWRFSI